ncbi:MAG: CYTH domain-containing protein [Acutalibacteraceae bacterium]|nr:CYTH domain-containing protein [Acutalibacteraceae bacterium]
MLSKNGYEIERKFLIKYPDTKLLSEIDGCRVMKMEQTYLEDGSRIRKIKESGKTTYIKTVKKHITNLKREEKEWEISREEYNEAIKLKAQNTNTINKTRYAVELGGFVYEIDVFDFFKDRAFLEVELTDEEESFPIPDFLKVIKEVTEDKRYTNRALAVNIVNEDLS